RAARRAARVRALHDRRGRCARSAVARTAGAGCRRRRRGRRAGSAARVSGRGARDARAADARGGRARVARMSRAFATIRYEKRGAVAVVTLDRPERLNAYDVAMRDDLFAAFGAAHSPLAARDVRFRRDVWGRLLALDAVTIAAVHGWTVGGGMEMALLCDLCIAAADARFALPETGVGMIPGVGGTQTVPRRAGTAVGLDVVLTGRGLDAREALAAGLVNRVVPRRALDREAGTVARRVARLDPRVARAIRRLVRAAF